MHNLLIPNVRERTATIPVLDPDNNAVDETVSSADKCIDWSIYYDRDTVIRISTPITPVQAQHSRLNPHGWKGQLFRSKKKNESGVYWNIDEYIFVEFIRFYFIEITR